MDFVDPSQATSSSVRASLPSLYCEGKISPALTDEDANNAYSSVPNVEDGCLPTAFYLALKIQDNQCPSHESTLNLYFLQSSNNHGFRSHRFEDCCRVWAFREWMKQSVLDEPFNVFRLDLYITDSEYQTTSRSRSYTETGPYKTRFYDRPVRKARIHNSNFDSIFDRWPIPVSCSPSVDGSCLSELHESNTIKARFEGSSDPKTSDLVTSKDKISIISSVLDDKPGAHRSASISYSIALELFEKYCRIIVDILSQRNTHQATHSTGQSGSSSVQQPSDTLGVSSPSLGETSRLQRKRTSSGFGGEDDTDENESGSGNFYTDAEVKGNPRLACPAAKGDIKKYSKCATKPFKDMNSVLKHIEEEHFPQIPCPVCPSNVKKRYGSVNKWLLPHLKANHDRSEWTEEKIQQICSTIKKPPRKYGVRHTWEYLLLEICPDWHDRNPGCNYPTRYWEPIQVLAYGVQEAATLSRATNYQQMSAHEWDYWLQYLQDLKAVADQYVAQSFMPQSLTNEQYLEQGDILNNNWCISERSVANGSVDYNNTLEQILPQQPELGFQISPRYDIPVEANSVYRRNAIPLPYPNGLYQNGIQSRFEFLSEESSYMDCSHYYVTSSPPAPLSADALSANSQATIANNFELPPIDVQYSIGSGDNGSCPVSKTLIEPPPWMEIIVVPQRKEIPNIEQQMKWYKIQDPPVDYEQLYLQFVDWVLKNYPSLLHDVRFILEAVLIDSQHKEEAWLVECPNDLRCATKRTAARGKREMELNIRRGTKLKSVGLMGWDDVAHFTS